MNFWHDLSTRRQVNKTDARARSSKAEYFVARLLVSGNIDLEDLGLDLGASGSFGIKYYIILAK